MFIIRRTFPSSLFHQQNSFSSLEYPSVSRFCDSFWSFLDKNIFSDKTVGWCRRIWIVHQVLLSSSCFTMKRNITQGRCDSKASKEKKIDLPNDAFVDSTIALTSFTVESSIEFIEVRRWTHHARKKKDRTIFERWFESFHWPKRSQRMNIRKNTVQSIGIGHFRAPCMRIVDEEHLLGRILRQTRKAFLSYIICLGPRFVSL